MMPFMSRSCLLDKQLPNLQMEPTRQQTAVTGVSWRAAHLARYADQDNSNDDAR